MWSDLSYFGLHLAYYRYIYESPGTKISTFSPRWCQERVFKSQQFDLPIVATLTHQLTTSVLGFAMFQWSNRRGSPTRRIIGPVDLDLPPRRSSTMCDDNTITNNNSQFHISVILMSAPL